MFGRFEPLHLRCATSRAESHRSPRRNLILGGIERKPTNCRISASPGNETRPTNIGRHSGLPMIPCLAGGGVNGNVALAGLFAGVLASTTMLGGWPAFAATPPKPVISEGARSALAQMGTTLLAKEFSFHAHTTRVHEYQGNEQLHIVHDFNVTVRRPDRLLIAGTGEGGSRKLIYDGSRRCKPSVTAAIGSRRQSSNTPFSCIRGSRLASGTHRIFWLSTESSSPMRRSAEGWRISVRSMRFGFGPCARGRLDDGISIKSSSRSPVGRCICGVLSMMKAMSSTFSSKPGATKMQRYA